METELETLAKTSPKFITLENIPQRDQEVIALAVVFFWLKYMRRKAMRQDFQPTPPRPLDPRNPFDVVGLVWEIKLDGNGDISGQGASGIAQLLKDHCLRSKLFGTLSDDMISGACAELEDLFVNQEWCAHCENWSYFDDPDPENFAFQQATLFLDLIEEWPSRHYSYLRWFCAIREYGVKLVIVQAILKNIMGQHGSKRSFLPLLENGSSGE